MFAHISRLVPLVDNRADRRACLIIDLAVPSPIMHFDVCLYACRYVFELPIAASRMEMRHAERVLIESDLRLFYEFLWGCDMECPTRWSTGDATRDAITSGKGVKRLLLPESAAVTPVG